MSWSVTAGAVPAQPVADIREALQASHDANPTQFELPEAEEQFKYAVEAVVEIAKAKVVGSDPDRKLNISISGHANPDHVPPPGTSKESLYISVSESI